MSRDLQINKMCAISRQEAEAFALNHGMHYFEADLHFQEGNQSIFLHIISSIVNSIPSPAEPSLLLGMITSLMA